MKREIKPSFTSDAIKAKLEPVEESSTMSPFYQRILIGVVVAISAAGIGSFSGIVVDNLSASSRIEASLQALSQNFDNFTLIRYQDDTKEIEEKIAAINLRIDSLNRKP